MEHTERKKGPQFELASSLAHALLEPLHHLLVHRHPWPARTTVLFVCRWEPECFALGIADDVRVRLGPQRGAVDYRRFFVSEAE